MTDPTAARLLARHAERRRQGLATVSVLAGRPAAAAAAWAGQAVVTLAVDPADAVDAGRLNRAVLSLACLQCGLLPAAVVDLARRTGRPPSTVLAGRTRRDLDHLFDTLADDDSLTVVRTVCTVPIDDWAAELSRVLPGWRALSAIDRLLPDPPSVWVAAPGPLAALAAPLAALATAVPRWPLGVGTSPDAVAILRSAASDSRADTVLLGGVVDLNFVSLPTAPAIGPVGVVAFADRAAESLASSRLAQGDATSAERDDVSDSPATPATPTASADAERVDDPARSLAERALFDLLNLEWPGLFALNVPLPFPFGPRPAEADLYADALRLAVEVDGYHHFRTPADYRRDRRKDWAYHAHGHRVARVLAEDVLTQPTAVLDGLRPVVEHCRRHPLGGGPTPDRP